MIIDLFQIEQANYEFDNLIQPENIGLDDEAARIELLVKISGVIKKGIAQVDLSGRIEGEIEIDCMRCLQPVKTPLNIQFKVVYVAPENYTGEREAEIGTDDLDIAIYDDEKLDLAEIAREQILLNLPTRFLCREDCSGLCQVCGANKNFTDCNCEEKQIDPRWSSLKDLQF